MAFARIIADTSDDWCFSVQIQIYKYGVQASSVDFFHFARDLGR
jgi:hypothetical protein